MGEVASFEVASEIFAVRCSSNERLKFEVEYGLKRGTTENSYVVKGQTRESTVLIDVPNQAFATSYRREITLWMQGLTLGMSSAGIAKGCCGKEDRPNILDAFAARVGVSVGIIDSIDQPRRIESCRGLCHDRRNAFAASVVW